MQVQLLRPLFMKKLYWAVLYSFVILASFVAHVANAPAAQVQSSVEDVVFEVLITPPPTPTPEPTPTPFVWDGPVLNAYNGTVEGPSGKETYYNLPMDYVVYLMRNLGYSEEEYPYWVRDDGCKMFGDYIMCAAALDIRPKGTILESSLGTCMVCDTGEFIYWNHTQIDIAVNW